MAFSLPFRFNSTTKPDGDFMMKLMQDLDAESAVLGVLAPATGATTASSWIPTLTFATPGDLNVAYSTHVGTYIRVGPLVIAKFNLITSAFTWTTASGFLLVNGLPFPSLNDTFESTCSVQFSGITKAGYTQFLLQVQSNSTSMALGASGSGQTFTGVVAADVPSGGIVQLKANMVYFTNAP